MTSIMEDVCDISAMGGKARHHRPRRHTSFAPMDLYDGGDGDSSSDSDDEGGGVRVLKCIIIAVAVILIVLIVFHMGSPKAMARRLAARGWVLVTKEGCTYCEKQLDVLGGKYPKTARCSADGDMIDSDVAIPFDCKEISGFPYWQNLQTGETKVGLQDKAALKEML